MKILHISTSDNGGAGLCCIRIHNSLLNANIDSKVLVLEKSEECNEVYEYGWFRLKCWKAINKILRYTGLMVTDYNRTIQLSHKTGKYCTLPTSIIKLHNHPLVKEADIIHLHWVDRFLDYPSFFTKVKKPIIWTLHDENLFYGIAHYESDLTNDKLENKYRDLKSKLLSNKSNITIVFLSEFMKDKFSSHEIIKDKRSVIINNSVNYKVFTPKDKNICRNKWNIPSDNIVFVFVAADLTDKRKGFSILVEAVSKFKNPKITILAVGAQKDSKDYPFVIKTGLLKKTDELSEAYSCGDFFIMPSKQEAFAQTPIEAMSCGIPAIVFPVSGTKELINENNGIICDGFTVNDLYNAMVKAINSKYNSKEIIKDTINRFSPETIAHQYIDLYKSLIQFNK